MSQFRLALTVFVRYLVAFSYPVVNSFTLHNIRFHLHYHFPYPRIGTTNADQNFKVKVKVLLLLNGENILLLENDVEQD